jgi:hypothetical protein
LQARQPWGSVRVLSTGNIYDLKGDFVWLGRSTPQFKTNVSFTRRDISRLHLLVTRDWLALDVRSLLGTTINAQPLWYGESRKLQSGDIIVLGGVASMQFERAQLSSWLGRILRHASSGSSKSTKLPGPNDWAILIDGSSRKFQYLQANPSFIGADNNKALIVENNPSKSSLLKVFYEPPNTDVVAIEDMPDAQKLTADWKLGDYEHSQVVIEPSKPVSSFAIPKARADTTDYCFVNVVTLSYDDLPFQIVPIVPKVDGGGSVAPRLSSAH